MKKFIAIITLVSILSCVSCSEKAESSTANSSSSSSAVDSSAAEESVAEESSEEESSEAESSSDGEYKDWYGLHMYIPTEIGGKKPMHTSTTGYPTWYSYEVDESNVTVRNHMIGYSMATTGAPEDGSEVSNEEALESFFEYEVEQMLSEAYSHANIRERNPEKTETVKILDKDFIRESGSMNVGNIDKGGFEVYYVCYVGTPGFKDSLFEKSPCIWIAFCEDEADKDYIAEMADRAANDLAYN